MRSLSELETTSNQRLYNRLRRQRISTDTAKCTICPPHQGENARPTKKFPIKKEFQLRRRKL